MSQGKLLSIAGLLGLTGVLVGAFGAHALHETLVEHQSVALWQTAVSYHLLHGVALLALAGLRAATAKRDQNLVAAAAWCWTGGVVLFSGSLYALALGAPRAVGPVTPMGGLLFLTGWILVILLGRRQPPAPPPP